MKTALLIIDVQNDYFEGGSMALADSLTAARNVRRMLDAFRGRHLPVFHVRHVSVREGATFFIPGTVGAEIHPDVRPIDGETIIEKHFPNSFRETELSVHLDNQEITDLVICGMMSEMCVDATVRAAFDQGFNCTLVHDACAAGDREFAGDTINSSQVHAAIMSALGAVYARITNTDEIISEITQNR